MRGFLLTILFTVLWGMSGFSQYPDYSGIKKNNVYLEAYLLRHAFSHGYVSINYERTIGKKRNTHLRIGAYPDFQSTVSFPLTVTWLTTPLANHHFEFGLGVVFRIEHFIDPMGLNSRDWFYDMPAVMIPLMYRYQQSSGFFFRGGINTFISWPTLPSPSVSLGFKF